MINIGGYEIPFEYEGIYEEHLTTRDRASIFDSCFMGEFRITGETVCDDLEKLFTCNISSLRENQCKYTFICNKEGGVIDICVIYRITRDKFLLVVNAENKNKVLEWIMKHKSEKTIITDISEITSKLDLQGPESINILTKIVKNSFKDFDYCSFRYDYYKSTKILISRTGYTGEIGFEIFCPHDIALSLWNDLILLGAKPAGFGCLNTLRIEMGFPLYGHELDTERVAFETGYKHLFDFTKIFFGSDRQFQKSILSGIIIDDSTNVLKGDTILTDNNHSVGVITSACFSPCLQEHIALSYVLRNYANPGAKLIVSTKKKKLNGTVSKLPFYKKATFKNQI
jgi:aminomethyltransferase